MKNIVEIYKYTFLYLSLNVILLIIGLNTYSQPNKRTNFWYFADLIGLDFNSGVPVEETSCPIAGTGWGATAVMCDTNGNLLFYSNGDYVWNRNHQSLANSVGSTGWHQGAQSAISLPVPGSDSLFYIFTARMHREPNPMFYYIVDMSLNNGLGDIIDIDTLAAGFDAADQIQAVYLKNKEDYWVVTRKHHEDKYAAFLVTSEGVNPQPVLSPAPNTDYLGQNRMGFMKFSYDKKYFATCFYKDVELCKFDVETGLVEYLSKFRLRDLVPNNPAYTTNNCDFSPCSKYMYLTGHLNSDSLCHVFQFDMQYIEDSVLFEQSAIKVGEGQGRNVQLGSDGKMYFFYRSARVPAIVNKFVGVIHNPEKYGLACNYQPNAFFLNQGHVSLPFVNFATDFLFRFDFNGICESDTFTFNPWFFPEPDYIEWSFGDPLSGANNTSTIPQAKHVFSDGGTYEVSVHVEYPSGRIEETSRKVEVEYSPEPDLGADTIICYNNDIILNAECGEHFYTWSTGAFGTSQIIVSDTGWYWVRVENDAGCFEIDSIHISNFSPAMADTNNLQVIPTTCGGSMGAVTGMEIIGNDPFIYYWTNDVGDTISTNIDIFHLPVGNYTLHVTDSNECNTVLGPYTIHDAGDVLIEDVSYSSEHCDQQNGMINIGATSGLTEMLFYSLDNGSSYFANQGVFTGLSAGSYAVRVKDSSDCQDVYLYNPIILENIPGPQIDNLNITPSLTGQNNGAIEILASGAGDSLYYSIDSGTNYQINNGWFDNLSPGIYNCNVLDEFGCDTSFIVEVEEVTVLRLQAVAGDDEACPGNTAYVPLIVTNFQDVSTFKATLLYNDNLLECLGYANAHSQLEDSLEFIVFPAEGKIELSWNSLPVTLPQQSILTDLVFTSTTPGTNQVEWDGQSGSSYFQNFHGEDIPVDYYMGNVKIYNEVSVYLDPMPEACEGDQINIDPQLQSSNGEVRYLWTYPNGDTSNQKQLVIGDIQASQAGTYYLNVTDTALCETMKTMELVVHGIPVPAFSGQDTISTDVPVVLDAGSNYQIYQWSSGETTQFITAVYEGWYGVLIESLQGCWGEDSIFVLFNEIINENIYVPNAFSPNGDGLNDEFRAIASSDHISSFHMYIFNSWGVQVFESQNISQGWDGSYKSDPAPSGAYVYKIEYAIGNSQAETKTITGILVLIR